ncbi:unnamed protein product [Dovyalis caffra]|uniref:Uncharacterized protein n=1 Tax=Dovyalis caffra TaxID=77055 RepID=A0AAV1RZT6_9ROSI|nr:unnamed protein product [Dovyalis caffra]
MGAISYFLTFLLIHGLLLSSHSRCICKAFAWEAPSRPSSDAISSNDVPFHNLGLHRRAKPSPPPPTVNPPIHFSPPPPRAPPPPPSRRNTGKASAWEAPSWSSPDGISTNQFSYYKLRGCLEGEDHDLRLQGLTFLFITKVLLLGHHHRQRHHEDIQIHHHHVDARYHASKGCLVIHMDMVSSIKGFLLSSVS